jgi:extradiol dioxygenase family protein
MEHSDWVEHRRPDGEVIGWFRPVDDGAVVIDLLGREVSGVLDWLAAEELLEQRGIRYLADPYLLDQSDGTSLRVRITEVSTTRIRVKKDDFGAIDIPMEEYLLPWPAPPTLRSMSL